MMEENIDSSVFFSITGMFKLIENFIHKFCHDMYGTDDVSQWTSQTIHSRHDKVTDSFGEQYNTCQIEDVTLCPFSKSFKNIDTETDFLHLLLSPMFQFMTMNGNLRNYAHHYVANSNDELNIIDESLRQQHEQQICKNERNKFVSWFWKPKVSNDSDDNNEDKVESNNDLQEVLERDDVGIVNSHGKKCIKRKITLTKEEPSTLEEKEEEEEPSKRSIFMLRKLKRQ
jgi:hypothetical protein